MRPTLVPRLLLVICVLLLNLNIATAAFRGAVYDSSPFRNLQDDMNNDMNKDKNNDMNKDEETPEPTPEPTRQPTPFPTPAPTPRPTPFPSKPPTPSPTPAPIDDTLPTGNPPPPPTVRPTTAPSLQPLPGTVGNLVLSLSVVYVHADHVVVGRQRNLHENDYDAADITEGRAPELVQAVLSSLLELLCSTSGLGVRVVGDASSLEATDYCTANGLRFLQEDKEETIVVSTARLGVTDSSAESLEWTRWEVAFPVVQVGSRYLETALENDPTLVEDSLKQEGLSMFQSVAMLALEAKIQDGGLDADWPEDYKASVTTKEVATHGGDNTEDPPQAQNNGGGATEPLDPAPLHALRVVGVLLLIATCGTCLLLVKKSSKRRMEREWDVEYKERGRGGLVTEEGLDYMLEVGRQQSMAHVNVPSEGRTSLESSVEVEPDLPPMEMSVPPAPIQDKGLLGDVESEMDNDDDVDMFGDGTNGSHPHIA